MTDILSSSPFAALSSPSPISTPAVKSAGVREHSSERFMTELLHHATNAKEKKMAETNANVRQTPDRETVRAEFREWQEKTPIEHFFEQFLDSLKMSKSEFEALPADEQAAILDQFEDWLQEKLQLGEAQSKKLMETGFSMRELISSLS